MHHPHGPDGPQNPLGDARRILVHDITGSGRAAAAEGIEADPVMPRVLRFTRARDLDARTGALQQMTPLGQRQQAG